MDFTQYIKNNDPKGLSMKVNRQPTPHLTDPILRRYHITRLSANSMGVYMGVWSLRLLAQNISGRNFRQLSPWLQLTFACGYLSISLYRKFYLQANRSSIIRSKILGSFNKQHYLDSQFWH